LNLNLQWLRGFFDGKEPFMSGHQIIKRAGRSQHSARLQRTPAWAMDDKAIQKLLLRSFPKLKTDLLQRARAARRYWIIYLYFRASWTSGQIASQLGLTDKKVRKVISRIRNAAKLHPRGRPKKDHKAF
jgi:hypothetical protein